MPTRKAVIQNVGSRLGLVRVGTVATATTTAVTDTTSYAVRPGESAQRYVGASLYFPTTVSVSALQGKERYVTAAATDTGVLTTKTLPGTPGVGAEYELHFDLPRIEKNSLFSEVLTHSLCHWQLQPLTLLADGDMEASGVTNWSVGSGTREKVSDPGPLGTATQVLQFTASGTSDYIESLAGTDVHPDEQLWVYAAVKPVFGTTATARLVPYNGTLAEALTCLPDDSWAYQMRARGGDWQWLGGLITVPANCRALTVRVTCDTDAAIWDVDDVIVLRADQRRYPAPSWLRSPSDFSALRPLTLSRTGQPVIGDALDSRLLLTPQAGQAGTIAVTERDAGRLVVLEAIQYYGDVTDDSTVIGCDAQWLEAAYRVALLSRLAQPGIDPQGTYQRLLAQWQPEFEALDAVQRPIVRTRPISGHWQDEV